MVTAEMDIDGTRLPLTLIKPDGPVVGGVVALHPADNPSRDQPLLRHLSALLPQHGVAVLLHDRRPTPDGRNVPLRVQAEDALAVADQLRGEVGHVPIGMWGWSQGAWAASLAATLEPNTAFLVLIAPVGVSPAAQMRHATAEHLRRAGYDANDLAELLTARTAYEAALRGEGDAAEAERQLMLLKQRPWWDLAWLPERLPEVGSWVDIDFDPEPTAAAARCPVLAVWGEDDPWLPIDVTEAMWRRAAGNRLTVLRLPETGHGPDPRDGRYERALLAHVRRAIAR